MKTLIAILFLFIGYAAYATCPVGKVLTPRFVRVMPGQPCPANYIPTTRMVVPNADGTCPPNYISTNRAVSVVPCDPARGICDDNLFVCVVD